jgi:hypothetical protein
VMAAGSREETEIFLSAHSCAARVTELTLDRRDKLVHHADTLNNAFARKMELGQREIQLCSLMGSPGQLEGCFGDVSRYTIAHYYEFMHKGFPLLCILDRKCSRFV